MVFTVVTNKGEHSIFSQSKQIILTDSSRLDSALNNVVPNISRPKKSRHFLLHWMSVKLTDNFQMREHSWPCRFHIKVKQIILTR
jgi:hypothetical protein